MSERQDFTEAILPAALPARRAYRAAHARDHIGREQLVAERSGMFTVSSYETADSYHFVSFGGGACRPTPPLRAFRPGAVRGTPEVRINRMQFGIRARWSLETLLAGPPSAGPPRSCRSHLPQSIAEQIAGKADDDYVLGAARPGKRKPTRLGGGPFVTQNGPGRVSRIGTRGAAAARGPGSGFSRPPRR